MPALFTVPVLDHGSVILGSAAEDVLGTDLKPVNAARQSFDAMVNEMRIQDERLLDYLAKHDHTSPFRHAALSLRVKCPIFVRAQWRTHTIASAMADELNSFNEASARYIEMKDEFYVPDVWRTQSVSNKQASGEPLDDQRQEIMKREFETALAEARDYYQTFLFLGVAREMARMILPQNLYTNFMWTASLQALVNFIRLRDHAHAQQEIREYARAVKTIVYSVFPKSAEALLKLRPPTQDQLALLSNDQVITLAKDRGLL